MKVRENLASYDEKIGWYDPHAGTVASLAVDDVMRRNGIAADGSSAPKPPAGVNKMPSPNPDAADRRDDAADNRPLENK